MVRFLPMNLFALLMSWQALLFVYARYGKRVPIVGNLMIAAIVSSAFVAGAMITGRYDVLPFPVGFSFLLVVGRELVKGAEDVVGDGERGAGTVAVRFGAETSVKWGSAALFACVLMAPVPTLLQYYGRAYGLAAELLFVPGVLVAAAIALRAPRPESLGRASSILKIEMFLGIATLALAR
jgi:geranylgeranylglycerol-phosphate geranylgeranyltransferase